MDLKILVVDDVNFSLEQLKSLFDRSNCRVFTAQNGQEAVDIAIKEKPNLILMDLNMPVMNGDEACRIIKADPNLRSIPIIMCTAARKDDERDKALKAGADDYVTKPILKVEKFFEKVKKFAAVAVREYERVPLGAELTYYYKNVEYTGKVVDVSEGGVQVEGDITFPVDSTILVVFMIPNNHNLIEAEGRITRSINRGKTYSGVQFTHITLDGKRAIASFVKANSLE